MNYPSEHRGELSIEQTFVEKNSSESTTNKLLLKLDALEFSPFNSGEIVDFKNQHQDLLLKITVNEFPASVSEATLVLFPKYVAKVSYFNHSDSYGYSEVSNQFRNRTDKNRYHSSQKYAFNIDHQKYDNTHYLLIRSDHNRFIDVALVDSKSYIKSDTQFSHFFTLVYSIILAMVLFNATFYFFNRDKSYLLYTLYILAALYSLLWQEGKINDVPWLAWRVLGDYSSLIYVALSDLLGIMFFYRFMRLDISKNLMAKLVAVCVVFRIVIMVTALIQFHLLDDLHYADLSAWFNISVIVSSVLIWVILLTKTLQKMPQAKYLFIAWSIMIFSVLLRIYFSLHPHPDLIWMPHSYELAVMFEGLVLAFAMANRTMQFKDQRDQAMSKYTAAERSIHEHQLITNFQQEMQDLVKNPTLSVEQVQEKTNIKFHLLINKAFPIKNSLIHSNDELSGFCTTGLQKNDFVLLKNKINQIYISHDKNKFAQYGIMTSNHQMLDFLYLPINSSESENTQFIFGLKQDKPINEKVMTEFKAYCEAAYTALIQAQEVHQVALAANLDSMTDCHNRNSIEKIIRESLKSASRTSVGYVDIDNLKVINDQHGHNIGDQCIIEFSQLLKASVKNHAKLGRVGGDEFLVVFSDIEFETCIELLELFMGLLEKNPISENKLTISTSIGLAESRLNETKQSLIKKSDLALYHSKDHGRNQLTVYDNSLETK